MSDIYAHTPNEAGQWHRLECHLRRVSELAADFAGAFGARELGRLVGLLHDAGKAEEEFRDYMVARHWAEHRVDRLPDYRERRN